MGNNWNTLKSFLMSGQSILVVGARGTGKTTRNKKLVSIAHPDNRLVLDINGEYKDLYPKPFLPYPQFSKIAKIVTGKVILIEEATFVLSNRGYDNDIQEVLVKARHNNNTLIFSYHTLRSIPYYIYSL